MRRRRRRAPTTTSFSTARAPGALSRRRAGRRRGDRAANRHHAGVLGRLLGAFRLAGRQPRDAGLRADQRGDVRRQGLVPAPLARRGRRCAGVVRAARGRRQSLRPAARLQRDLPGLRPRAEMEAARDISGRPHALPRRRDVPRLRLPQEQAHVRARLFRRSGGLRPLRPGVPRRDVSAQAGQT